MSMILGTLRIPTAVLVSCDYDRAWNYAVHSPIDGKERRVASGEQAPGVSMSLFLHAFFLDPGLMIAELNERADAREVLVLQDEGGLVRGQYVIESVPVRPVWTLPDGRIVCARVDVRLVDPGLDAILEAPAPSAVEDAPGLQTVTPPQQSSSAPKSSVPASKIARTA